MRGLNLDFVWRPKSATISQSNRIIHMSLAVLFSRERERASGVRPSASHYSLNQCAGITKIKITFVPSNAKPLACVCFAIPETIDSFACGSAAWIDVESMM